MISPGSGGASAEAGACANGGNRAKAGGSPTGFRWAGSVGRAFGNLGELF